MCMCVCEEYNVECNDTVCVCVCVIYFEKIQKSKKNM